jgi:hypothetical protein
MPCGLRDVAGGDDERALGRDRQPLRPFDFHADRHALEVQDDVGHVLADARHRRELVQDVVDLDAGDRRALQRAHQHAAQRVAERQAEATLERFGDDGRLARRIVPGANLELRRLDQFLPVLVDHACLLNSCPQPMSGGGRPRFK